LLIVKLPQAPPSVSFIFASCPSGAICENVPLSARLRGGYSLYVDGGSAVQHFNRLRKWALAAGAALAASVIAIPAIAASAQADDLASFINTYDC